MAGKQAERTTGFRPKHWGGKGREGKPPTHGSGRTGVCESCGKPGAVTHDNGFRSIVMTHPHCAPDGYVRAHIEHVSNGKYIALPKTEAAPATHEIAIVHEQKSGPANDWQLEQLLKWAAATKA